MSPLIFSRTFLESVKALARSTNSSIFKSKDSLVICSNIDDSWWEMITSSPTLDFTEEIIPFQSCPPREILWLLSFGSYRSWVGLKMVLKNLHVLSRSKLQWGFLLTFGDQRCWFLDVDSPTLRWLPELALPTWYRRLTDCSKPRNKFGVCFATVPLY